MIGWFDGTFSQFTMMKMIMVVKYLEMRRKENILSLHKFYFVFDLIYNFGFRLQIIDFHFENAFPCIYIYWIKIDSAFSNQLTLIGFRMSFTYSIFQRNMFNSIMKHLFDKVHGIFYFWVNFHLKLFVCNANSIALRTIFMIAQCTCSCIL